MGQVRNVSDESNNVFTVYVNTDILNLHALI